MVFPGRGRILSSIPLLALVLGLAALALTTAVLSGINQPALSSGDLTLWYFVFAVGTVFVVRRVSSRPGPWLSRRLVRRTVVAVAGLSCLVLLITPPDLLGGTVALLLIVLALCNVLLGRATSQITVSLPRRLDERQGSLRDRAFRSAYWIVAGSAGVLVVVSYLATDGSRAWLGAAVEGGPVVAFIALLICLPAMLIAWLEPDRATPAPPATRASLFAGRLAMTMVVVSLLAPVVGAATVLTVPSQVGPAGQYLTPMGSECAHFQRVTIISGWFGTYSVRGANVCWNDHHVRVVDFQGQRISCDTTANLVTVSTAACGARLDSKGTLRVTYAAMVRPAVLSFLSRKLDITFAVDRRGRLRS
ncbi:MAG TPA: hypothetical protein VMW80_11755 [Candidatus Dormibacteraeota bacterium]|nr:hypothetical protein [Candidatus Dormibacteraeota bacterium]